jgi:benzylsuccinate CoA-transferase BbsF subunit
VLDKLGLGYDVLRAQRSDLIMLSSTGFGCTGPNRGYVTWGPNIEALCGLASLSGFLDPPCTITQYAYPDALSALHGLYAVLCALVHRDRTGEGQFIDLSQYETMVAALGPAFMEALALGREPRRTGNASYRAAPQGCYRCEGDDRWIAISVRSDPEWVRFAVLLGGSMADSRLADEEGRRAHAAEIDAAIESWTRERDAYEAMTELQANGIAAGVVQTVEDLYRNDRQLEARAFFETIPHAIKGPVVATGIPLGLTATRGRTPSAGEASGAHNSYVLETVLGLTPQEIAAYVESGAVEESGG